MPGTLLGARKAVVNQTDTVSALTVNNQTGKQRITNGERAGCHEQAQWRKNTVQMEWRGVQRVRDIFSMERILKLRPEKVARTREQNKMYQTGGTALQRP